MAEPSVLRCLSTSLLSLLLVLLLAACAEPRTPEQTFKNVIVMVPDGVGQSTVTLSRWWKGEALALDSDLSGAVRTYMSSSVITDSAAAATAFATGYKTSTRFVSVGPTANRILSGEKTPPERLQYKPLATVLEAAKLQGKATGLVATSSITHATPAAFSAHTQDREMDNEIMEQLVYQDIDVVFGGGKQYLIPAAAGGKRKDGEDLLQILLDRGYLFVETKKAMNAVNNSKVWGLFANNHMEANVDRDEFAPQQPSLAEMTDKAIRLLAEKERGFFLFIEGSQVDWAGHDNDPYYRLTEFLAFDDAYRVAKEFARQDGHTLVIAFPDHNTGGMSIGQRNAAVGYSATSIEDLLEPLQKMHSTRTGITSTGLDRMINADLLNGMSEPVAISKNIQEWWGIKISGKEVAKIMELREREKAKQKYDIGEVIYRSYSRDGITAGKLDSIIKKDISNGMSEAAAIRKNLLKWWGVEATEKEIAEIIELKNSKSRRKAVCEVIGRNHTVIGWTTRGHTGDDVPLWVYGINGAYGVVDNTALANIVADALGVSLASANDELFVDAKEIFPEAILDVSDTANPVLRIGDAALPVNKDILEFNGETTKLNALVVYAPLAPTLTPLPGDAESGRVYIPKQAINIIKDK